MSPASLRSRLLLGILLPVLLFVAVDALTLYRKASSAADTAYDRTLLASSKSIGELLEVVEAGGRPRLKSTVLYSALEAFEADNRSRMYFKVTGFEGEMVSGFADLPPVRPDLGDPNVYAALVRFYDDEFRGQPVRMAVLLQPVAGESGQGIATIQVAETLELRKSLAAQLLVDTLWQQAALILLIALVVTFVVQRATQPVRDLSASVQQRSREDLSEVALPSAPRELQPVVAAINTVMARLAGLLANQKRFVRDASHQLRTPLAVLQAQVQSARRGDVDPAIALKEIDGTVQRAIQLANQMLALAKVEQLAQQRDAPTLDWQPVVRDIALELSALIAEKHLNFEIELAACSVRAHEWSLRELTRNLLHNAIKHSPQGSDLAVSLEGKRSTARLTISDSGPGLGADQRSRLFQPFAAGDPRSGSGLGLAICHEIVRSLAGEIALIDRPPGQRPGGLDAVVSLPMSDNPG